jgi:hypothetical protein
MKNNFKKIENKKPDLTYKDRREESKGKVQRSEPAAGVI